jgi:hypothetical protein
LFEFGQRDWRQVLPALVHLVQLDLASHLRAQQRQTLGGRVAQFRLNDEPQLSRAPTHGFFGRPPPPQQSRREKSVRLMRPERDDRARRGDSFAPCAARE